MEMETSPPPPITGNGGGSLQGMTNFGVSLVSVFTALFSIVAAVGSLVATLLTALPLILGFLAVTAVLLPWVKYHDRVFEEAEFFMRTQVYPLWRDTIREVASLVREVYNPVICWWNAANWWGYGMTRFVILPTALDCGVKTLAVNFGAFLKAVVEEAVLHVVTGRFMTQKATWPQITAKGVNLANSWIALYTCSCSDLADIVRVIPLVNPLLIIPPVWGVLAPFSQEWADPQLWCALENAFNAVLSVVQQALRLVQQILRLISGQQLPSDPFVRPEFRDLASFLCGMLYCLGRSTETAWQAFWDKFVPFKFVFKDYLCLVDSLACIFLKTVALLVRILINIDQVVLYPANPFWEVVIKQDIVELINRWAAPTYFAPIPVPSAPNAPRFNVTSYFLDPAQEYTPLGAPNPLFQTKRITECLCIFITRTICDPSDESTGCFSQGGQQLLMGLDFCCLTTNILNTLADVVSGLFELSLHLARGSDDFFLYADSQPFTTTIKDNLVRLVRCILSVFTLIPVVGNCIRDLVTGLIEWFLCMVDFLGRVIIGLVTLPYYIIAMPGIPNFLQSANEALDFFVAIQNKLVAPTPTSVRNCLSLILNEGFPVPPIPCASCTPSGFVHNARDELRLLFEKDGTVNSPVNLLREVWGELDPDSAIYRITPLLRYTNHTSNPITLVNMMMVNAEVWSKKGALPFTLAQVDASLDEGKRRLLERWARVKTCNAATDDMVKLRHDNPTLFAQRMARGEFSSCANPRGAHLPMMPPYGKPTDHALWEARDEHAFRTMGESVAMRLEREHADRLTLGPVENTTMGCDPEPACFDLACVFRTSLDLIVLILQILARFFNGLIQGGASLQGSTQDFPYFTGEFCDAPFNKPCFQSDVTNLVLALFRPIKCLCQALNLIIPVAPSDVMGFTAGRPDICCAIQRISELLACIIQVIFNTVEAIALGANEDPAMNFSYFRMGQFTTDVNVLFDIALEVVVCLCTLLRALFPLNFIPGFAAAVDFEVCCIPQALLNTLIEIVRGILQVIISLATITIDNDAFCYWRLDRDGSHQCSGKIDDIGVIRQTDIIIDSFLPRHGQGGGACYLNCANDNGASGIVPCICQIFNTLIPFRRFPGNRTNCDFNIETRNCPEIDFCCPFSKLGFLIADSLKFINRGLVTLWQPWTDGLPEFFLGYVFCYEGTVTRCPVNNGTNFLTQQAPGSAYQNTYPTACEKVVKDRIPACPGTYPVMDSQGVVHMRCGEFLCGRLNVVIRDLTDPYEGLIAKCTCQFFGLLDRLVALLFRLVQVILPFAGWSCCFCGGLTPGGDCRVNGGYECDAEGGCRWIAAGPCIPGFDNSSSGAFTSASYVGQAVITALINLIRQFPLACYWKPYDPITQVRETWIFSFLGPTANALCIAIGNLQCFAQSMFLLPQVCTQRGQRFLGSTLRWAAEVIFRVIGFIEAFVRSFIEEENTCIGPNCDAAAGSKQSSFKGVDQSNLGKMMVILLSIPIDLLIGDSEVACTTICPSFFAVPAPTACGCWNRSPNFGNNLYQATGGVYEWTTNATRCLKLNQTVQVLQHIGTNFGNTTGCCDLTPQAQLAEDAGYIFNFPVPACQSPDDFDLPADAFYNDTQRLTFPAPGSCAKLGACRPDSLPSCANDPMTPIALSAGYTEAVDGIVMGLLRYMRCLLSNIIGCDGTGKNCVPLGLIFYPAMLIFSLSWQILGGFIKFQVAMILFFFSIFQPPEGDGCSCWEHTESTYQAAGEGGVEVRLTRYYKRVAALCYNCIAIGHKCGSLFNIGNGGTCYGGLQRKCEDYCPIMQRLRQPTISEADAMAACIAQYNDPNTTKPMNTLNATEACSGHFGPRLYQTFPPNAPANCTDGPVTITAPGTGLCAPGLNLGTNCRVQGYGVLPPSGPGIDSCQKLPLPLGFGWTCRNSTQWPIGEIITMMQWDACPDPACQYNATPQVTCGISNAIGIWDCGGNQIPLGDSYNDNPLLTCGPLQIVSNFLAVFDAFLAIFTTPLIVPPANGGKRAEFVGPVVRESRQAFDQRVRDAPRYSGTMYGLSTGQPNAFETVVAALYNYDTSDCWADPVACACRNLDMRDHCMWTHTDGVIITGKRKRDGGGPMTTKEITQIVADEMFTGTTPCDHIVRDCAGMDWNMTSSEEQNLWVNCFDKLVRGDRMKQLNDVFPRDFMYNSHAMQELANNMYGGVKGYLARRVEEAKENLVRRKGGGGEEEVQELHEKFPHFTRELVERRRSAHRVLQEEYNIRPHDLMYDAIIKADQIHYKYSRGYYSQMLRLASRNIREGRYTMVTTETAVQMMRESFQDLTHTIRHQPYAHIYNQTAEMARVVSRYATDVMEEGVVNHVWNQFQRYTAWRRVRFDERDVRHVDTFVNQFQRGALYQLYNNSWYTKERRVSDGRYFGAFRDHMARVVEFQRTRWQNRSFTFFNADLKFWGASDILLSRWQKPHWTPAQRDSWERVERLYYQVYNRIWPGHLTREQQERFLFLSNCVILDRTLDITVKVIDYCANEAGPNLRRYDIPLLEYFNTTSPYRNDTYYGWQNRGRFVEEPYVKGDDRSWIRPRLLVEEGKRNPTYDVDYRVYRLATRSEELTDPYAHGPARFNFFSWLLRLLEDVFAFSFGARSDDWFASIQNWLTNTNTAISAYPDVGLLYWLRFSFICNFPENLNCSIGAGFETALLWTSVGFVGLVLVGAYVFPLATLPFQLIGYGISFFLVLMAVAFHFPAACLVMPSFPVGIGVAYPQCAADSLIAFADKWITNCYSPLVLPPYMISGEACPVSSTQRIDMLNCRDVGVSDGIQNALFLGVQLFGSGFIDIVMHFAGSVVGIFIPGIREYLQLTLEDFKSASATQMERQWFCFWATLPTMVTPLLFLFLAGLAAAVLVVPLVLLLNALLDSFVASPLGGALPGVDDSAWIGEPVPSQPAPVESGDEVSLVGRFLNLGSVFSSKKLKVKRE